MRLFQGSGSKVNPCGTIAYEKLDYWSGTESTGARGGRRSLKHYATSRKVAGSIADGDFSLT